MRAAVRLVLGLDDSQFAARREEGAAGIDAIVLFDIARALHFAFRGRLRGGEGRFHGR